MSSVGLDRGASLVRVTMLVVQSPATVKVCYMGIIWVFIMSPD